MAASYEWTLLPGDRIRRTELHDRYGGNPRGGITRSASTPNVLVFAGKSGREHGYFDRIGEDGLFHYTGMGQKGDQVMQSGNRALRDHREEGRAIRVFLGVGGEITYVGEFELADDKPFYPTEAPSTAGGPSRTVLMFRLRPVPGARMDLLKQVYLEPVTPPRDWNRYENDRTVDTYVDLLLREIDGEGGGATLLAELRPLLPGRQEADIRNQLRRISGLLDQRGSDWLEEFEPLSAPSSGLREAVRKKFGHGARISESLEAYANAAIAAPGSRSLRIDDVLVSPPSAPRGSGARGRGVRIVGGRTSALDDFRKRELGKAGEEWVVQLEQRRLKDAGKPSLADKVRWVSELDGDGDGYDIRSYWPDGRDRWIEVKTTNRGIRTPFFITSNEVEVSVGYPDKYSLYRVHGWTRDPRIYVLDGSVEDTAKLEPAVFRGYPR